jgi:hypothetical protein
MPEKKVWFSSKFFFHARILEAARIRDFRSDFSNRTNFGMLSSFQTSQLKESLHVAGVRFSVSGNAFCNDRWNALRFLLLKENPL